jgi:hypothetical protein
MITVSGNVMFHTNHDNWGSRHRDWYDGNGGKNDDPLDIEGNYWQQGDADSAKEHVTVKGNHLINALSEAPANILKNAGLQEDFRDITSLQFSKPSAPEAPSRVAAWAGNHSAYVTWSPSVQQGTTPVEAYIVHASNGAEARISDADFWKYAYVKMDGLPNDQPLTFTVAAINRQGASVDSLPTLPVTAHDEKSELLAAPENVHVLAGKGAASIHFQLPPAADAKSEGSPILAYAVKVTPGDRKVTFTGRNIVVLEGKHASFNVVDGLKSGTAYTFSVSAVNDAGEGTPAVVGPVMIP